MCGYNKIFKNHFGFLIYIFFNENYFEDLDQTKTEEIFQKLLEDKFPDPGSAKNRKNNAPEAGKTTLLKIKNA